MKAVSKSPLKAKLISDLERCRQRLAYSYNKVSAMDLPLVGEGDDESLETLESFSSRFARFSDLVISRYLRICAIEVDPAFRGTVIDLLNFSEKMNWIESATTWRRIRELRNVAAHEYTADDYMKLYKELIHLCPHLLNFRCQS